MPDPHPHRAAVPPVADGAARPLWSVMIPTYNCARYLREALESVLVQDPGPAAMQIEVVDDGSEDDPAAVVEAVGRGRVGFFRQRANVGHTRNFQTCLARSRGWLVHLLHGDDYVLDGFYQRLGVAFATRPDAGAAFCRHIYMDAQGRWQEIPSPEQQASGVLADALVRLAGEQRIMTPAIVARREVYEKLGGFDDRLVCSEDWEMWVRIAAHYPVWYEPEALAVYRMHDDSNTGRHVRSGEDMRYTAMAIDMFETYLPRDAAAAIAARARETYALAALDTADRMLARRDVAAALTQAREAIRLRRSPRVARRILGLTLRAGVRWLGNAGGRRAAGS